MERRMDRRDRERSRGHLASTSTGSNAGNSGDQQRADFDSRTPLAWQHRDFNYQQHSTFNERYPEGVPSSNSDRFSHPSLGSRSARSGTHERQSASGRPHKQQQHSQDHGMNQRMAASQGGHHNGGYRSSDRTQPSSEETTTGSSSETESDSNPDRGHQSRPGTSGTLRSMQSVPLMSPLHTPFNPAVLGGIYGVGMVGMLPSNTWNGEPCPVHGASLHHAQVPISMTPYPAYHPPLYSSAIPVRRAASVHELAMATPLPALMPPPPPTTMSIYGTLPGPSSQFLHGGTLPATTPTPDHPSIFMMGPPSLMPPPPPNGPPHPRMRMIPHRGSAASSLPPMPPPSLLPPMQRPATARPLVVNEKNGHAEPLPVREAPPLPLKIAPSSDPGARSKTPSKSSTKAISYDACCRGNVVVLWIILGIIGLGIVLGVVFYFAFQ